MDLPAQDRNAAVPDGGVIFPGSGAIGRGSAQWRDTVRLSFVPASGRALVFPIYKSTHERTDSLRSDIPAQVDLLARPCGDVGQGLSPHARLPEHAP